MIVWPVDGATGAERAVTVSVTNRIRGSATAVVRLAVPARVGSACAPRQSRSAARTSRAA